jgi:predicted PurR-regulated permease PerM
MEKRRAPKEPSREAAGIARRTSVVAWTAIAIVIGVALLLWFLQAASAILLVLFVAIIFAEAIRPLVMRLNRWFVPRWLATLIVYLLVFAVVGGLVYLLVQPLVGQLVTFSAQVPGYVGQIERILAQSRDLNQYFPILGTNIGSQLSGDIGSQLTQLTHQVVQWVLAVPQTLFTIVFDLVVTLFLAFYWLNATDGLREFTVSLFPATAQPVVDGLIHEIGYRLGGYVRGVVTNMFVIGILAGLADLVLGVPYPLLLGIFAGLMEAVPIIGPYISAVPALLLALTISPIKMVEVIIAYVVVQVFENNTLVPLVMDRAVGVNPLLTLLAVLIGGVIFGIPGALLAVPVTSVLQTLFLRVLVPLARDGHITAGPFAGEATKDRHHPPMAPPPAAEPTDESVARQEPVV